jgi:hypothetical protein
MVEDLFVRIRVSLLWIFVDYSLLLLLTINTLDSGGGIKEMVAGFPSELVPVVLLGGATILLIPFVMALLTMKLEGASSRRVNILLGGVFLFFNFSGVAYGGTRLSLSTAYLTLLQTAAFIACFLIVWTFRRARFDRT